MITHEMPASTAILSNVGAVNSFTIKATARSFKILSDGLYANKIRAIIRELSCNAFDSHVAAGKKETPFDVHLPNQLEPWFSIRDYGVGLSAEQVTNIFTTFFESTKTGSNDFVGALGLGSKSPFSYTDNFTVTAVKDGNKGIYSAFINNDGVPSIALMMQEDTTEPAGVEIRFSVEDRYDFDRFAQEASSVFKHFVVKPVVSGRAIQIEKVRYADKDIVPGVSLLQDGRVCVAVMGNIEYPINVPSTDKTLGDLVSLFRSPLELQFEIGELDFQASREGLSYIPMTMNAIKRKLEALNAQLAVHIAEKADKIENLWERADFLSDRVRGYLYSAAVKKYIADTNFPIDVTEMRLQLTVKELQTKFNVSLKSFSQRTWTEVMSNNTSRNMYGKNNTYEEGWSMSLGKTTLFVYNDTNVGATERAKYHFKTQTARQQRDVYVIDAFDKTKPVKLDEFYAEINNPPVEQRFIASELHKKERVGGTAKNVTILMLEDSGRNSWSRSNELVWRESAKLSSFDDKQKYYYVPLSGYNFTSSVNKDIDIKRVKNLIEDAHLPGVSMSVYGVRKGDIEAVKAMSNWINLEDHLTTVLNKVMNDNKMEMVKQGLDKNSIVRYNDSSVVDALDPNSPFAKFAKVFANVKNDLTPKHASARLLLSKMYAVRVFDPSALIETYNNEANELVKRYPLLDYVSYAPTAVVSDYINMIDQTKGM
jgi:hypothetical protein